MNRPQSKVPRSDSTINGIFIHPWAASPETPEPRAEDRDAGQQSDHHPVQRVGHEKPRERQPIDRQRGHVGHVDQAEHQDQQARHPDRAEGVGPVAAAEVEEQPVHQLRELRPGAIPRTGAGSAAG